MSTVQKCIMCYWFRRVSDIIITLHTTQVFSMGFSSNVYCTEVHYVLLIQTCQWYYNNTTYYTSVQYGLFHLVSTVQKCIMCYWFRRVSDIIITCILHKCSVWAFHLMSTVQKCIMCYWFRRVSDIIITCILHKCSVWAFHLMSTVQKCIMCYWFRRVSDIIITCILHKCSVWAFSSNVYCTEVHYVLLIQTCQWYYNNTTYYTSVQYGLFI